MKKQKNGYNLINSLKNTIPKEFIQSSQILPSTTFITHYAHNTDTLELIISTLKQNNLDTFTFIYCYNPESNNNDIIDFIIRKSNFTIISSTNSDIKSHLDSIKSLEKSFIDYNSKYIKEFNIETAIRQSVRLCKEDEIIIFINPISNNPQSTNKLNIKYNEIEIAKDEAKRVSLFNQLNSISL